MIVCKYWTRIADWNGDGIKWAKHWQGWFLFGILPLYIRQV